MTQLLVRNISDSIVKKLKKRAVEHGVSAEEEHRRILREALETKDGDAKSFKEHLLSDEFVVDELPLPARESWPTREIGL